MLARTVVRGGVLFNQLVTKCKIYINAQGSLSLALVLMPDIQFTKIAKN